MQYVIDKFLTILVITAVLFLGSARPGRRSGEGKAPGAGRLPDCELRPGRRVLHRPAAQRPIRQARRPARHPPARHRRGPDHLPGGPRPGRSALHRATDISSSKSKRPRSISPEPMSIMPRSPNRSRSPRTNLLLVDASDVELRGWDKPEVRFVVEKTVLEPGRQGHRRRPRGNPRDPSQGVRQGALRLLQRHRRQTCSGRATGSSSNSKNTSTGSFPISRSSG